MGVTAATMTNQRCHDRRRHPASPAIVAIVALLLSAGIGAGPDPRAKAPRLLQGDLPVQVPETTFGGGEVVLELAVDARGEVTRIAVLRATPPYADLLADAAADWRFEPAVAVIEGVPTRVASAVLLAAVVRPPTLYAGPAAGVLPQALGTPSPSLPQPASLVMPAYPPRAKGNAYVLIEIEMSAGAAPLQHRIFGPPSGFDGAALDAVRAWRFAPPRAAADSDRLYVYAIVGFRTPLRVGHRLPHCGRPAPDIPRRLKGHEPCLDSFARL
jgi:hypothetical protein